MGSLIIVRYPRIITRIRQVDNKISDASMVVKSNIGKTIPLANKKFKPIRIQLRICSRCRGF